MPLPTSIGALTLYNGPPLTAADLLLLLTMSRSTGDAIAGALLSSVAFIGVPMLAALVYQNLSRPLPPRL